MPFYDFVCPNCEHLQEELQGMEDKRTATCEVCGSLSAWSTTTLKRLNIVGDTCSGNMNWSGYDEMLGVDLSGKGQRKEEMKRQGLEEFVPNPAAQSARDEAKYVRNHAPDRDPEARKASSGILQEADRKRRDAAIDSNVALDRALDKAVAEVSNSAG